MSVSQIVFSTVVIFYILINKSNASFVNGAEIGHQFLAQKQQFIGPKWDLIAQTIESKQNPFKPEHDKSRQLIWHTFLAQKLAFLEDKFKKPNDKNTNSHSIQKRDLLRELSEQSDILGYVVNNIFKSFNATLKSLVDGGLAQINAATNGIFASVLNNLGVFLYGVIDEVLPLNTVDSILRTNEYNHDFYEGSVKSFDSNQLASNNPMEDTRSEAKCNLTTGLLFGVFDGHGGGACAQVIAKRLYKYIAASLLPAEALEKYISSLQFDKPLELFDSYNDKVQFVDDIRAIYNDSFLDFINELKKVGTKQSFEMSRALEQAFLRLDDDLSREALPKPSEPINMKTLSVAMTGAVACVAHVDGPHLHIAHVGDCNAILGVITETNSWMAKKLTTEHNSYNQTEVDRILKEHPRNEANTVIKMERLLGQLAPLRAIGDFRYKWSKDIMSTVVTKYFGEHLVPPNYYTPPYLTAKPEVIYHKLTPRDKFLILATDGLWDIISPLQVVRLVGEHMSGKVTLSPLKLPRKNMTLNEINGMLLQRKEGLKTKPKDSNAATHLIRNALGGTEYGIDHGKLSQLLSLPEDVVRVFRDDITITIVYFDSEYLRHCPA